MQGLITFTIMPSKQTVTSHLMHKLKVIKVSNITVGEQRSRYHRHCSTISNATTKDDLLEVTYRKYGALRRCWVAGW